ncbi:HPr family phosphocarrier protein [Microbacterium gorillae]|uniref:HPr family phosphocarrier protein n=1 Tax=Microbacterium gorillae TaxID=1231063 RepID=UPI00058DE9F0|nr:HPr family phosphocarrier protein [Microbacterium gorillae]
MTTVSVTLGADLHARPAAAIADRALAGPTPVSLATPTGTIDAASVLALMAADLHAGDDVTITAADPVLCDDIAALLRSPS